MLFLTLLIPMLPAVAGFCCTPERYTVDVKFKAGPLANIPFHTYHDSILEKSAMVAPEGKGPFGIKEVLVDFGVGKKWFMFQNGTCSANQPLIFPKYVHDRCITKEHYMALGSRNRRGNQVDEYRTHDRKYKVLVKSGSCIPFAMKMMDGAQVKFAVKFKNYKPMEANPEFENHFKC